MGASTCQILVGKKHSYDGGIINITHQLYLSENDRPAWVLTPVRTEMEKSTQQKIVWIPTLKNMLEDALVMIGLYVLKDEPLRTLANQFFQNPKKLFIELYKEIPSEDLQKLYEQARKIESAHKIIVSVFHGSSILSQLPILKNYQNDVEVCTSVFSKEFSLWTRKFEEIGDLE
ncbi:hypothetical protein ACQYAD_01690 [Neobacillus sp. SM06]|uniref:hypothetical protein n=1 Tax=Neobacillus sp. SM06 TaxID=3422492 RepID=UPI003D26B807